MESPSDSELNAGLQRCKNCYFYRIDFNQVKQGTCREKPPLATFVQHPNGSMGVHAAFPPVEETEWCGRWRMKIEVVQ